MLTTNNVKDIVNAFKMADILPIFQCLDFEANFRSFSKRRLCLLSSFMCQF